MKMVQCFAVRMMCTAGTLVLLSASAYASTPTSQQIDTSRAKGLAWLYQTQKGDGSWRLSAGLPVQSTSAVLNAMMKSGIKTGRPFYSGVAYLANAQPSSTDGQSRQIDTLYAVGNDVTALMTRLSAQATALNNSWGTLPGYATSVADTSMAATTMMNTNAGYTGWQNIVCGIIALQQRASGGWSYTGSVSSGNAPTSTSAASILPTAMTIPLVLKIGSVGFSSFQCVSGGPTYSTATMAANAVAFLKTKLNADGGFGDNGTSGVLETAMAYLAIQAVNPSDASLGNAQGYLVTSQKSDGSWASDPFQTALALQAYPSTTLVATAGDGMPDAVKAVLGLSTGTPSRGLQPGNGQSVAGVNKPLVTIAAYVSQAMSYSIVGSGGTSPYQFTLASGSLPPGLSISSSGVVSGTPTAAGPYSFTLQQTDASSALSYVDAQVNVGAPQDVADAPTLPEWGAILMGLMLMTSMAISERKRRGR